MASASTPYPSKSLGGNHRRKGALGTRFCCKLTPDKPPHMSIISFQSIYSMEIHAKSHEVNCGQSLSILQGKMAARMLQFRPKATPFVLPDGGIQNLFFLVVQTREQRPPACWWC